MPNEPQGPVSGKTGGPEGTPGDQAGMTGKPNPNPDLTGTSEQAPDSQTGRADQTGKGTSDKQQAPDTSATDKGGSDFDLNDVPEELRPHVEAYAKNVEKQLKANYTKKTQEIAKHRQKIEAYDAFERDPEGTLRQIAERQGFTLNRGAGRDPSNLNAGNQVMGDGWQPQTWSEVFDAFAEKIKGGLLGDLKPVFDNIQTLTTKNIETQLSEIDPDWKLYEDDMISNLKTHPTLAKDVSKLYKMSVPDEVLESRATQKALKRFEDKAHSAKVGSKSSVATSYSTAKKVSTFDDAVSEAKRLLAEQK